LPPLDGEAWLLGIGSVHALANGAIDCDETNTRYGDRSELDCPWLIYAHDLTGTRLTAQHIAAEFDGDIHAAARAFLNAAALLPNP
jgi:hypothetical protein